MIIYIFNNPFPGDGGFSKRCLKVIEILSETNEIIVVCRSRNKGNESNELDTKFRTVPIYRFNTSIGITDKVLNYKNLGGLNEAIRNVDLLLGLFTTLIQVFWKYKKNSIKIYSVVSPLTVPMIAYFTGFLFRAKPEVIEFHDLEPELASHIKKLNKNSLVMRIELLLEKISCHIYKKVIVTSKTQAKRLIKRTGIKDEKIIVIPNSIQVQTSKHLKDKSKLLRIGYISSFSYEYNIVGFIEFIKVVSECKKKLSNIEIFVVGDGELLPIVISEVKELQVSSIVNFIGKQRDIAKIMSSIDVGIIPWKKDQMTETILPTKLFEYMEAKKVIIAPNFGEFSTILSHNTDALLYNSYREIIQFINEVSKDKSKANKLMTNSFQKFQEAYRPDLYVNKLQTFVNS